MPKPFIKFSKPDALELFTDRQTEQEVIQQALAPPSQGNQDSKLFLTAFYGVGGVGKTTLCRRAREIAGTKYPDQIVCVYMTFDDHRWTPGTTMGLAADELCKAMHASGIEPLYTSALLAVWSQAKGMEGIGGGMEEKWQFALDAVDKGVELVGIPGVSLLVKGALFVRDRARRQAIRKEMVENMLWPTGTDGGVTQIDIERKLPESLCQDVMNWLRANPKKHMRLILDGFERLQGDQNREDAQKGLQEFIGYFAASDEKETCSRFRTLLFGREKLKWDSLYDDPGWKDYWNQHNLGGLAEIDARDFLQKAADWRRVHGYANIADVLARMEDRVLDSADEKIKDQRVFYPYFLDLAVDAIDRSNGQEPDLGKAPAELQERFLRYAVDGSERRALMILAIAETFDERLFDWLVEKREIVFPINSFRTELHKGRSYFQQVEANEPRWKFHRLMEDALHRRWLSSDDLRREGRGVVHKLLDYHRAKIGTLPPKDWTDRELDSWIQGMEIIVTQGPELGLLENNEWENLFREEPWQNEHPLLLSARLDFARRTYESCGKRLGPEHLETLRSCHNYANLLVGTGDYKGAVPLYRQALDGLEKANGPDDPKTLTCRSHLGSVLQKIGNIKAAELLMRQALERQEKILGAEHPDTLASVNNLACLLSRQRDYDGAEPLYRRILSSFAKIHGPEHRNTLTALTNLGAVLGCKGNYEEAEAMSRRALDARERTLGAEHPETLDCVNNLADLLNDKGDAKSAESLCRRVLAGRDKILGPEHPDTLASVNNLAVYLMDQGDLEGAESLFRRALDGRERALGRTHPRTLASMKNLACLLSAKGNAEGAEALIARAAKAQEFRNSASGPT